MTADRQALEHLMVEDLSLEMHIKLGVARAKGRGGWAQPDECAVTHLWDCLHEHVKKPNLDMVDVANLAGMVWWRLSHVPEDRALLSAHLSRRAEYAAAEAEITRLNWMTQVKLAHAYRAAGHDIPHRMEEECGFVLQHLLALARVHGAQWRAAVSRELEAASAAQPEVQPPTEVQLKEV